MSGQYVASVRKSPRSDYWIDIPDIPGCVACGETMEEAKASFREAIVFHLEGIDAKVRENLPESRSRAEVVAVEEDYFIDDYLVEINTVAQ